jgi:hypothetical protein
MKRTNHQTPQQELGILREDFLDSEEIFVLGYLDRFNRAIAKRWQEENIGIFSTIEE